MNLFDGGWLFSRWWFKRRLVVFPVVGSGVGGSLENRTSVWLLKVELTSTNCICSSISAIIK